MKKYIVISLDRFRESAEIISRAIDGDVAGYSKDAFKEAFDCYEGIIAVMSAGIAVRNIAPLLNDKWTDPPVVVVSPDMKYAVPVTGGHHGGNEIAKMLTGLGIEPVITTATESMNRDSVENYARRNNLEILNKDSTRRVNAEILDGNVPCYLLNEPAMAVVSPEVSVLLSTGRYIVGIGCRRGVSADEVISAIRKALNIAGIDKKDVLAYSTTVLKRDEAGLTEAVRTLSGNLVFVSDEEINDECPESDSRAYDKVGLKGVAEPSALSLSKSKKIILKKQIFGRVTIAVIE
ncbi:cobalt-precorrin 5A hydrolase [Methanoplanus limicola]|uniref:Cobalamin (Vitamin B12) biosynthesis CbiG protein n=1 Tax=Methanoplanus limicola DSM 2279 TaxID=937775 RepID=H1YX42_9EURY|nr:cobalt-precorrin 5A hydrolase [Methanoplanus limicola]EHQ35845.1 cobalamin (vitamin B12) biosynthesis CbiG protein [Methanoplanus limicola DSM 2279]